MTRTLPAVDRSVPPYDPRDFEGRWQQWWEEQGLYRAEEDPSRPTFYGLEYFPYPSGDGLSVGHCRNYVPSDVVARFMRMRGSNVLHPMGWDAFGEPTENAAIQRRESPRLLTDRFAANYKRQMRLVGIGYDWSREIDSSRPEYYRWTQWFFLLLYRMGLAYRATQWQWWCPTCQTTMSESEVYEREGELYCWRDHPGVTKREIAAWLFRITAYADRLLADLAALDWPDETKRMQANWIGRSEGAAVEFAVEGQGTTLAVFTTRPDTVCGVTFLAIAPEHALVAALTAPERRDEVEAYVRQAARTSDVERLSTEREKTGVPTGAYAVNPVNGARVPVVVADYVLGGYGTGVVMGVPAHDQRDFEFARRYGLPVRVVIAPPGWDGGALERAYVGPGRMVGSGRFDGLASPGDWAKLGPVERRGMADAWGVSEEALDRIAAAPDNGIAAVTAWLAEAGCGGPTVSYRMHDWVISRQKYWGTPIPIVYCDRCGEVPVPEERLPVELPELANISPPGDGRSALARAEGWVNTDCPTCGGAARRETDTMGGFACSSWYYLRFTSPHERERAFDPARAGFWMPVDLYVGGAEHAVMHLLYARFWYKAMGDAGLDVPGVEPFPRLRHQGQVLAADGRRMSKSRGNVVTPDEVVERHGADSLRVFELFVAPFEGTIQWSEEGMTGCRRFLRRVWEVTLGAHAAAAGTRFEADDPELTRLLQQTIRRTTEDIERFRFNTMVAGLMELANALAERYRTDRWRTRAFQESVETLLRLLAPSAPHIAEELWARTGGEGSIHRQAWPAWDEALAREPAWTIVVQVDGRTRDRFEVAAGATEGEVTAAALARERVRRFVPDPERADLIYVPGRLVNVVRREE